MSVVRIEKLRKTFGVTTVLSNFNLLISEGEFVVLLGPSGCGKTTVLRSLAGLETPSDGRISIGSQVVHDTARSIAVPTQRRNLGLVFQSYALWPHMTVFENVAYPLRIRRLPASEIRKSVADILDLVGLAHLAKRPSTDLSGGQQQRVALARALVASPQLLLLDEPLSNLDAERRTALRKQLRDIHRQVQTTTLYVTHDQIEALTMADRVLIMNGGNIEQIGTPREVFHKPVSAFAARFLGYENILDAVAEGSDGNLIKAYVPKLDALFSAESKVSIPKGQPLQLAFRASSLVPLARKGGAASTAGANRSTVLTVQLTDIAYLGESLEYSLFRNEGRLLSRVLDRGDDLPVIPGSEIDVAIAPRNVIPLLAHNVGAASPHQPISNSSITRELENVI
ncbi:ABC transporter ATP-binding protein [Pseudochelatococcus sp. B33]